MMTFSYKRQKPQYKAFVFVLFLRQEAWQAGCGLGVQCISHTRADVTAIFLVIPQNHMIAAAAPTITNVFATHKRRKVRPQADPLFCVS